MVKSMKGVLLTIWRATVNLYSPGSYLPQRCDASVWGPIWKDYVGRPGFPRVRIGDWQPRQKGSIGSQPTGGFPGQFTPGQFGYGSVPAYLGGTFPSPIFATYNPIAAAPYQFTDPEKFAESFGKAGRKELQKLRAR